MKEFVGFVSLEFLSEFRTFMAIILKFSLFVFFVCLFPLCIKAHLFNIHRESLLGILECSGSRSNPSLKLTFLFHLKLKNKN